MDILGIINGFSVKINATGQMRFVLQQDCTYGVEIHTAY